MREILFRAKRTDNGDWETGNLVVVRGDCSDEQVFISDKMTGYHTPVLPETVGQFTGFTDMTGSRIFEGDIITTKYGAERVTGVVEYDKYTAAFVVNDGEYLYRLGNDVCCNKSRVKGNIHDNPELIAERSRNDQN